MTWYWIVNLIFFIAVILLICIDVREGKTFKTPPVIGAIEINYDDPNKDMYYISIDDLDDLDRNDAVTLLIRKK